MFFLRFTYIVIYRAFYILLHQRREARWGTAFLKKLEKQFSGNFDERTFKKIIFYYSLKVPAICDAFLHLHKKKTQRDECERLLHYFICSSVFDNFFDRQELSDENIEKITFHSANYVATNFTEKISLNSHLLILNYVRDKQKYLSVLKKEFDVQVASRRQFNTNITNEEIEKITLEKGGNAVLLCSFYLNTQASLHEESCWYKLGNIIQYVNDLFDIHRDLQSGLQTIPNRMSDAHSFKNYYDGLVWNLKQEIQSINIPQKQKLHFTISLMGICALGYIAIDQLISLQGNKKKLPDLTSFARKDLIIDMEKKSNLWKWIKTVYRLAKT